MPSTPLVIETQQHLSAGRAEAAFQLLDRSPTLHGDDEALRLLTALALQSSRAAVAARHVHEALRQRPDAAAVLSLRAAIANATGQPDDAIASARRAVELDPGQEVAASILVQRLADDLQLSAALRVSEACLQRNPGAWGVRLARCFAWMAAGEAPRALADAEAARAAAPHSLPARLNCAMASLYLDEPAADTLRRHQAIAREIPPLPGLRMAPRAPYVRGARPLRIGFVSPDMRNHPVGQFMEPLLRHLDAARAQAVVYSDGAEDERTARLRMHAHAWRDVRQQPDAGVFELVQRDAIDVLVDLAGYSSGSRPRLFATRCAPRQAGYLGYLHRTALPAMDGIVGDAFTLPDGAPDTHERALRLPGHMLAFDPDAAAPPVRDRDPGPLRFGSFNHLAKLSDATVHLWARVLAAVPDATLALAALGLSDPGVQALTRRRFAAAGCDPQRIRLLPPDSDPARFLAQYHAVDVALDPLPFNGGTTSLQALWQGVPVLTLPGERMAARMGGSIMQALGLDRFVARDDGDYVAIAAALAADPASLADLRRTLRDRVMSSGVSDGRRFGDALLDLLEAFAEAPSAQSWLS